MEKDVRQELHDLLLSCGLSTKEVSELCGVGFSTVSNTRSASRKYWCGEETAHMMLEKLTDYLTTPSRPATVKTDGEGVVVEAKNTANPRSKVIFEVVARLEAVNKRLRALAEETDTLEEEKTRLQITLDTLRGLYN